MISTRRCWRPYRRKPNMVYVIDKDGKIACKENWT
jgi:hypothetical protein